MVGRPLTETKGSCVVVGRRNPPGSQAATVVPVVGVSFGVAPVSLGAA